MKRWKITGTMAGDPVNLLIEEETPPQQEPLPLFQETTPSTPYVNGADQPLPWEEIKKKRERPRKALVKQDSDVEPITEGQSRVLTWYVKMQPEDIAKLTKQEAQKILGEYYKEHPYHKGQ